VNLPRIGGTFNVQDNQATGTLTQPRQLTPQVNGRTLDEKPVPATPPTEENSTSIPTVNFDLADEDESDLMSNGQLGMRTLSIKEGSRASIYIPDR